ncbi:hypothetical protein PR048_024303 [Dryococelus australis]|uniref:Uncharacterized protein n=1 Tax=Dryococelus australis TaxID=614101 RepID=A0ABQ9GNA0_9NEOP|nr:hypothetical protein PR048_024303 [Dryococelus australis]
MLQETVCVARGDRNFIYQFAFVARIAATWFSYAGAEEKKQNGDWDSNPEHLCANATVSFGLFEPLLRVSKYTNEHCNNHNCNRNYKRLLSCKFERRHSNDSITVLPTKQMSVLEQADFVAANRILVHPRRNSGGRGGLVGRLLASHIGELCPISGGCRFRIFARENRARRCRWAADFLGDLPFPPPLHSGTASHSPRFTLIRSQYLDDDTGLAAGVVNISAFSKAFPRKYIRDEGKWRMDISLHGIVRHKPWGGEKLELSGAPRVAYLPGGRETHFPSPVPGQQERHRREPLSQLESEYNLETSPWYTDNLRSTPLSFLQRRPLVYSEGFLFRGELRMLMNIFFVRTLVVKEICCRCGVYHCERRVPVAFGAVCTNASGVCQLHSARCVPLRAACASSIRRGVYYRERRVPVPFDAVCTTVSGVCQLHSTWCVLPCIRRGVYYRERRVPVAFDAVCTTVSGVCQLHSTRCVLPCIRRGVYYRERRVPVAFDVVCTTVSGVCQFHSTRCVLPSIRRGVYYRERRVPVPFGAVCTTVSGVCQFHSTRCVLPCIRRGVYYRERRVPVAFDEVCTTVSGVCQLHSTSIRRGVYYREWRVPVAFDAVCTTVSGVCQLHSARCVPLRAACASSIRRGVYYHERRVPVPFDAVCTTVSGVCQLHSTGPYEPWTAARPLLVSHSEGGEGGIASILALPRRFCTTIANRLERAQISPENRLPCSEITRAGERVGKLATVQGTRCPGAGGEAL